MTKGELRKIFRQAIFLLNDIESQNELIDQMPHASKNFWPECARKRYTPEETDELPNARGEFGRTPTNPILVNRTWGEITYLSRLTTSDGQRMIFHRAGSVADAIDAFELVSEDGKFFDVLYVDMYHRHCSKKAPAGYTLLETLDGITGTSENNPQFPERILETLVHTAINKFGAPIVSPAVLEFDSNETADRINISRSGSNLNEKILGKYSI